MEHKNWNLPRDVFLHLLMIGALYASVISVLTLLFQYVNVRFPDELVPYFSGVLNHIRTAEAVLLVVFPLYLFLSWLLERDFGAHPEKRGFAVRKWLIYFTLFISAVTIVVTLIMLIYNFLGGDLRIHFALKVLSVLISAAVIFGYYIWDLRRNPEPPSAIPRAAAIVSSLIMIALVVLGFFIVGSPATQRARRFDEQRISDLQTIQNEIINQWMRKETLPENLDVLKSSITGLIPPADPETHAPYQYMVTDPLGFELCAEFRIENQQLNNWPYYSPPALFKEYPSVRPYAYPANDIWNHGVGHTCFSRTIDPEIYKPQKPPF